MRSETVSITGTIGQLRSQMAEEMGEDLSPEQLFFLGEKGKILPQDSGIPNQPLTCVVATDASLVQKANAMENRDMARYIDHTVLAANTTRAKIERLCQEARTHKFFSVCVNSSYVEM